MIWRTDWKFALLYNAGYRIENYGQIKCSKRILGQQTDILQLEANIEYIRYSMRIGKWIFTIMPPKDFETNISSEREWREKKREILKSDCQRH